MYGDSTELEVFKQDHPYRPGIRQARKLKVLAKEFADNNIQRADKRGHSPLEDARSINEFISCIIGLS